MWTHKASGRVPDLEPYLDEYRIRVGATMIDAGPPAAGLRSGHDWEAPHEPRTKVADRRRWDGVVRKQVAADRLPRIRIHVADEHVFLALRPNVRVAVEVEVNLGRRPKADGTP